MIETQILGSAVGIQRGNVIDNTEGTVLPSLANGVLTGRFKRGRQDKPFKVTSDNYRALLGHDPSNPSYLAVEDAFKRGISELSIVRVGDPSGGGGGAGGGGGVSWADLPIRQYVDIWEFGVVEGNGNYHQLYASIEVNGVLYFADKDSTISDAIYSNPNLSQKIGITQNSGGYITVYANAGSDEIYNIRLSPEVGAFDYNRENYPDRLGFVDNGEVQGLWVENGDFYFRLTNNSPVFLD